MPLPPHVVRLKRKRDEEPVDFLFVQRESSEVEGRSPKRPLKFTRLRNEEPIQFLDQPTGAGNPQTTSRHVLEDKPSLTAIKHAYNMQDPRPAGQDPRSPSSKLSRLAGMNKGLHASSRSNSPASSVRVRREPRRFYLMKEHSSSSSGAPYHGVTKRRYTPRAHGLRPGLAIFAAESEASLKRMNQSSNYTMHDSMPATDLSVEISNGAQEQYRRPIRRPNATSEERRWRDENWNTGSSRTAPAIRDISMDSVPTNASQDDGSLALAADLQDFTLEQIGVGPSATEPARPFSSKYKPRPPPRRHIGATNLPNNSDDDNDDDSVYDTFVPDSEMHDAHSTPPSNLAASSPSLLSTSPNLTTTDDNYGLLVVTESDEEEVWEFFEDDDGREAEDWNSDEEDENAEDYYGNDYPEDEDGSMDGSSRGMDSDDDHDNDAYDENPYYYGNADDEEEEEAEDDRGGVRASAWSDDGMESG